MAVVELTGMQVISIRHGQQQQVEDVDEAVRDIALANGADEAFMCRYIRTYVRIYGNILLPGSKCLYQFRMAIR